MSLFVDFVDLKMPKRLFRFHAQGTTKRTKLPGPFLGFLHNNTEIDTLFLLNFEDQLQYFVLCSKSIKHTGDATTVLVTGNGACRQAGACGLKLMKGWHGFCEVKSGVSGWVALNSTTCFKSSEEQTHPPLPSSVGDVLGGCPLSYLGLGRFRQDVARTVSTWCTLALQDSVMYGSSLYFHFLPMSMLTLAAFCRIKPCSGGLKMGFILWLTMFCIRLMMSMLEPYSFLVTVTAPGTSKNEENWWPGDTGPKKKHWHLSISFLASFPACL
jgi:hypothetical protein